MEVPQDSIIIGVIQAVTLLFSENEGHLGHILDRKRRNEGLDKLEAVDVLLSFFL